MIRDDTRKQLNICHVSSKKYLAYTFQGKVHVIVHDSIHYKPHIKFFLNYSSACFDELNNQLIYTWISDNIYIETSNVITVIYYEL